MDFEGNNITRKQVLPYLVEKILPETDIVKNIFGEESKPTEEIQEKVEIQETINKNQIRKEIINQTNSSMMVSINKYFKNFNENKELFFEIIHELVDEKKIILLASTDKQIVVSKPLTEDVF